MQQVTTLSKRIDARSNENRINNNDKVTRNSYYGSDDEYTVNDSNGSIESDHQEMKKLREQVGGILLLYLIYWMLSFAESDPINSALHVCPYVCTSA